MSRKSIIAVGITLLLLGGAFIAGRVMQEPKTIPSEFLDKFFAARPELRTPIGESQDWRSVPMFGPSDPHEIETINGIELKVYKGPDGKKHYVGPPGLRMSLDDEGKPLDAYIDAEKAAQVQSMMKDHIKEMHKKMDEEKRLEKQ
jgi:hypothetical protein